MDLSVILPTRDSGPTLHRTIECLRQQAAPGVRYEIIVVDDGSTDGSTTGLDAPSDPVPVRVVTQRNRGRGAARNRGAAEARGAVLLFLDADMWAQPGLIAGHMTHHRAVQPLGVLGRTIQHPDTLKTVYMRATNLIPDATIRRRRNLAPVHVITRNFSVTADAFEAIGGFDEGFVGYGWEDMELGLRLRGAGVSLWYEPAAAAYHYHVQTLEEFRVKIREAGTGAVYFWRRHGRARWLGLFLEIAPALLPLKWLVYRTPVFTAIVEAVRPWAERHALLPLCSECYNHLTWRSYYDGVYAALRSAPEAPA
jgi:glycosyltransferase involved in cell wall biosynthesis